MFLRKKRLKKKIRTTKLRRNVKKEKYPMKKSIDRIHIAVFVVGLLIGLSTGAFLDTTKTGQELKQKYFTSLSTTTQHTARMTR